MICENKPGPIMNLMITGRSNLTWSDHSVSAEWLNTTARTFDLLEYPPISRLYLSMNLKQGVKLSGVITEQHQLDKV